MPSVPESSSPLHPMVLWAQRKSIVYLTVDVDLVVEELTVTSTSFHCRGSGSLDNKKYECTVEFNAEIDPENWRRLAGARRVELVLTKRDATHWWPRLTRDATRTAWIKTDFQKWRDEDELSDDGQADKPPPGGAPCGHGQFDFNDLLPTGEIQGIPARGLNLLQTTTRRFAPCGPNFWQSNRPLGASRLAVCVGATRRSSPASSSREESPAAL